MSFFSALCYICKVFFLISHVNSRRLRSFTSKSAAKTKVSTLKKPRVVLTTPYTAKQYCVCWKTCLTHCGGTSACWWCWCWWCRCRLSCWWWPFGAAHEVAATPYYGAQKWLHWCAYTDIFFTLTITSNYTYKSQDFPLFIKLQPVRRYNSLQIFRDYVNVWVCLYFICLSAFINKIENYFAEAFYKKWFLLLTIYSLIVL